MDGAAFNWPEEAVAEVPSVAFSEGFAFSRHPMNARAESPIKPRENLPRLMNFPKRQ
jgi:hypothetical protein